MSLLTPEIIYVIFLVKEGENPKSSKLVSEPIVIKIAHMPICSDDKILRIMGKSSTPEPICSNVAR
jgi:hypothetical protein